MLLAVGVCLLFVSRNSYFILLFSFFMVHFSFFIFRLSFYILHFTYSIFRFPFSVFYPTCSIFTLWCVKYQPICDDWNICEVAGSTIWHYFYHNDTTTQMKRCYYDPPDWINSWIEVRDIWGLWSSLLNLNTIHLLKKILKSILGYVIKESKHDRIVREHPPFFFQIWSFRTLLVVYSLDKHFAIIILDRRIDLNSSFLMRWILQLNLDSLYKSCSMLSL